MWKKFIERLKQLGVLIKSYKLAIGLFAVASAMGYGAGSYEEVTDGVANVCPDIVVTCGCADALAKHAKEKTHQRHY